jgi:hypothetical protein
VYKSKRNDSDSEVSARKKPFTRTSRNRAKQVSFKAMEEVKAKPSFRTNTNKPEGALDISEVECYGCGRTGHYKNECPNKELWKKNQKSFNRNSGYKGKSNRFNICKALHTYCVMNELTSDDLQSMLHNDSGEETETPGPSNPVGNSESEFIEGESHRRKRYLLW